MSQLQQAGFPTVGQPQERIKFTWPGFVQIVLKLTVQAYQVVRKDNIAKRNWEENTFTILLGEDYLRTIAFDNELPVFVQVRPKRHTKEMKTGEQATIEAKEIDLMLYGSWERDYHKKHFVWEAKRVGDKRVDIKYSKLNSEYVHEAIYRFIRREYADGLDDAGVLGYVLAGNVESIVEDINQTMGNIKKNPPLPEFNHLKTAAPIDDFKDIYQSKHTRTDNSEIQLHHLFLSFDFPK